MEEACKPARAQEIIWRTTGQVIQGFSDRLVLSILVLMGRACYIHDRPPTRGGA